MDNRAETGRSDTIPGSRCGRILVVDDSRVVRLMLAGWLSTAGFEVDEAGSGSSALGMLASGNYGVVITDLQMPGLDGFEVLTAAKELALGIEVIILTGAHDKDMGAAIRALRSGAHDYLTKPPGSAEEVVLTVERAMEKRELRESNRRLLVQLETLALTDGLTGVPNRRAFETAFEQEVARARRHGGALGVLALDIDHFKSVNDTHGHGGGDEVLRHFAQVVMGALRKGDSLYRCGGEEFCVILPLADTAGVLVAGKRIVEKVARSPITVGTLALSITTSAGAACLGPDGDGREILARADAALYKAKSSGRNRLCFADGPSA